MRNDGLGQASNKTGRNTTQREREEKRILSGRDKTVPCFQAESSQVGRTTALTRDWDHLDLVAVTTNSKTTEKPKRGSRSSEALVGSGSRVEQQETITTACHHSRWDGTRMGLYGCAKALHELNHLQGCYTRQVASIAARDGRSYVPVAPDQGINTLKQPDRSSSICRAARPLQDLRKQSSETRRTDRQVESISGVRSLPAGRAGSCGQVHCTRDVPRWQGTGPSYSYSSTGEAIGDLGAYALWAGYNCIVLDREHTPLAASSALDF
ncbi:hypothetical protein RRG08_027752 [Elysia crispata]|uniref:Uncharacterized protein n=1 Tax=Elysia crispata TaxID=231223 RepID=A0AAE0ZA18_9GAST|nr:hypothetical protein RRG08_027752 [Elysia crispata]